MTTAAATLTATVSATTTFTAAASGRLGASLRNQLTQLAVCKPLTEGAHGEPEHSHSRAQVEGLLQGAG